MDLKIRSSYLTLVLGMLILSLYACEPINSDFPYIEDCENYDYYDCNTSEPFESNLVLNFTMSSRIKFVAFEVYKGYVDDDHLYFCDTSWESSIEYRVPVDEYYSVMAIYHLDDKTIKVIDGGAIKTQSKRVCDSICWSVNELFLNVYIK